MYAIIENLERKKTEVRQNVYSSTRGSGQYNIYFF